TASASILADEVIGHSVDEALGSFEDMRRMLTNRGDHPGDEEQIGDGVAFAGVSKYPARVKCALLGWTAFTDALVQAGVDITATATSNTTTSNSTTSNTTTGSATTGNTITNNVEIS